MEQEKKHQPFIEVTSSREDAAAASGEIQPSAVRATEKDEGTTHSGDVELHNTVAADTDLAGGSTEDSSKVQNNDDDSEQKRNLSEARESINTLRGRVRTGARRQASSDYKERLRKRMEKEKKKLALKELARKSKQTSQRRSFGQSKENDIYYVDEETESQTSSPVRFKTRSSRTRSKTRARSLEIDEVFKEQEISEGFGRSYGSKNKARPVRQRPSPRRNKISESSTDSTESRPTRFKPRRPSFSTRNRFKSRNDERIQPAVSTPATTVKPTQTKNTASAPTKSVADSSVKPKIVFKKFNRFERPDLRKSLRNKFFAKRPDLKRPEVKKPEPEEKSTKEIEEIEKQSEADDLAIPGDNDSAQSALVPSIIDDENILQNLENEEIRLERLLTTLEVSTLHPQEMSEEYLEVATIRSPYTFNIEDNQKSTRFITITKTNTRSSEINPSNSFTSTFPSGSVRPSPTIRPSAPVSSTPLFDIASIPAPENILASSEAPPYEAVLQGSSDVEFLAPLTLTSSLHQATPPLKTVTESLSTVETVVKRSILPVVWGTESSLYTLSQTYTITKVVTAVKTVPPMELYEFSPEHSFADFDTLFEEAGSENRESLLPGELEFSDQDNFGLEGPSLIRVEPPEEFLEDFDLIGTKFDHTEKNNEQDKVESFVPVESQPTPSLPDLGLAGLGVTPEQLLYLQLLQNPLAALGIGGGLGKQVLRFNILHSVLLKLASPR